MDCRFGRTIEIIAKTCFDPVAKVGNSLGIPVLIKDNIDTADRMMTTAGSLALVGHHAASDSFVAQKLRGGRAVILGKTILSEWANFRGVHSTSGWSECGGITLPSGQCGCSKRKNGWGRRRHQRALKAE